MDIVIRFYILNYEMMYYAIILDKYSMEIANPLNVKQDLVLNSSVFF